jgi:hypothetical protein
VPETPDPPATSGNEPSRRGRDRRPAALALACGRTVKDAAAECGVSERSIRGWMRDARFTAYVRTLQAELFKQAVGRLAALSGLAADTLGDLMQSASVMARLGACRAVLEAGPRLLGVFELEQRVAELERRAGVDGP